MRLYKRGKTWTYDIQWKDKRTGELSRIRKGGFPKKKDAEDAGKEIERKVKAGIRINREDQSLYDFFEKYIENYVEPKNVAASTLQNYGDTLSSIDKYFPYDTIQNMTPEDYQQGLNSYGKDHAKSTAQKFHTQIKSAVKRGIFNGDIERDFTEYAIVSGTASKKESEKYISESDLNKLVQHTRTRFDARYPNAYLIFLTALTGMRFGEALGLTWDDIDFEKHIVDINKAWDYKRTHRFTGNKTLFSPRKLKVTEDVIDVFKDYQKSQKEIVQDNPNNLVFYSPIDGVPTNDGANDRLRSYLAKLDIHPSITMHGLRHSHASVLFRHGISVPSISQRLGHKNTTITYSTYIHIIRELEKEDESKIIDVLENFRHKKAQND